MSRKHLSNMCIMVLISCLFIMLSTGKTKTKKQTLQIFDVFDTYSEITVYGNGKYEEALEECNKYLHKVHSAWSYKIPESDIAKLNAGAGVQSVEISEKTRDILEKSQEYRKLTNGCFDITTGSVSMMWDIGGENRVPTEEELNEALMNVGEGILRIDDNTACLTKDKAAVSLGAVAKGYAAKEVMEIIKKHNIASAVVNLGGNVYTMGRDENGKIPEVGIMDPKSPEKLIGTLSAEDVAVVTSGDYMRYFEKDGKKYHHILNPYTGMPADNGLLSVTIVGKDPLDCDVLSTAVFVAGYSEGIELVKKFGCSAVVVTDSDMVYYTADLDDVFEFAGEEYKYEMV